MTPWNIDESAKTVNVKKTKGDTWRFRVTFKQGGVPIVGITDWVFRMQVRHPRTGEILADLSLGAGIEFTGNDGQIEVTLSTSNLECNQYPYDLEFERPDDYLRTPFGGIITISKQVTQV